jgi:hypothetical protein
MLQRFVSDIFSPPLYPQIRAATPESDSPKGSRVGHALINGATRLVMEKVLLHPCCEHFLQMWFFIEYNQEWQEPGWKKFAAQVLQTHENIQIQPP